MSDVAAAAPGPDFPGTGVADRPSLTAMLEARTVALVGASPRPGSLGERMVSEVTRSPSRPEVHLVNPRHQQIAGRPCHASLADLPGPLDLVLLAVPDPAVEEQLALAAHRGDRSAVLFGSAHELPGPPPAQRRSQRAAAGRPSRAAAGRRQQGSRQARRSRPCGPGWPPRPVRRACRCAGQAAWASST